MRAPLQCLLVHFIACQGRWVTLLAVSLGKVRPAPLVVSATSCPLCCARYLPLA